jgi:cysteine sulfinate desulfinase/cysteine desulfurase-like protein
VTIHVRGIRAERAIRNTGGGQRDGRRSGGASRHGVVGGATALNRGAHLRVVVGELTRYVLSYYA